MPRNKTEEKLLEKELLEAGRHIKKIIASGGKIKGVFYYTGNRSGDDAALVVNLMAKDKKGANAESIGKKLRKTIPQAKYKRGTVEVNDEKKLVFRLLKGNASAGEMRKAFRKNFAKKSGLGFIKKAVFAGEEVEESDAVDEEAAKEGLAIFGEDLELSPEEMAEINIQLKADPDLAAFFDETTASKALEEQNAEMKESFLRADAEEEEWADFMTKEGDRLRSSISNLEAAVASGEQPRSDLEAARTEFAHLHAQGEDLFEPKVGTAVDENTRVIMAASNDDQSNALNNQHIDISSAIAAIYTQMNTLPEESRKDFIEEQLKNVLGLETALHNKKDIIQNI
jgi:hypothetical protein